MLLIRLDPSSPAPAYLQIRDRIVALIEDESLGAGARLPATRKLAGTLGVHRSTVLRAYEEIRALGYLESRPGSYTTVRRRPRLPTATDPPAARSSEVIDWDAGSRGIARRVGTLSHAAPAKSSRAGIVDFERLAADPELTPAGDLMRSIRRVLRGQGSKVLDYSPPAGWAPLRETISKRLRAHGVGVTAEEILITSGAQHALDLVLRMWTRPGDRVVVEAPTYGMAHHLLRLHGLHATEIPMLESGMDLDRLGGELERSLPKLVYTMPNSQNPTGITTDQKHRERLLEICERHRVPLLEDGFEEEMKYFGKAVLPIKSMDSQGIVLYVGTFSKVVFPGLRLGWVAGPRRAIEILTSIQHASSLSMNTLAQASADRFCQTGDFEAHLRRVHRIYRRRMVAIREGLRRHVSASARWSRPTGGYTLWMSLADGLESESIWCERFEQAGVKVAEGSRFFAAPNSRPHFRLSIACTNEDDIELGCRRLAEVLSVR